MSVHSPPLVDLAALLARRELALGAIHGESLMALLGADGYITRAINAATRWQYPTPGARGAGRGRAAAAGEAARAVFISFGGARIQPCASTPDEARMAGGSYTVGLYADVTVELELAGAKLWAGVLRDTHLFDLPVPPPPDVARVPGCFLVVGGRDLAMLPHFANPASDLIVVREKPGTPSELIKVVAKFRGGTRGGGGGSSTVSVLLTRAGSGTALLGIVAYSRLLHRLAGRRYAPRASERPVSFTTASRRVGRGRGGGRGGGRPGTNLGLPLRLVFAGLGVCSDLALREVLLRGEGDMHEAFQELVEGCTVPAATLMDPGLARAEIGRAAGNIDVATVASFMDDVLLASAVGPANKAALLGSMWRTAVRARRAPPGAADTDREHLGRNRVLVAGAALQDVFDVSFTGLDLLRLSSLLNRLDVALLEGLVRSAPPGVWAPPAGAPRPWVADTRGPHIAAAVGAVFVRVSHALSSDLVRDLCHCKLPNARMVGSEARGLFNLSAMAPAARYSSRASVAQMRTLVLPRATHSTTGHDGHASRIGFVDHLAINEGEGAGTRVGIARGARVSVGKDPDLVLAALRRDALLESEDVAARPWLVFLEGAPIGSCGDGPTAAGAIRAARDAPPAAGPPPGGRATQARSLDWGPPQPSNPLFGLSVFMDPYAKEVRLLCDAGRMLRAIVPLRVARDAHFGRLGFEALSWVDAAELRNAVMAHCGAAVTLTTTAVEPHMALGMGERAHATRLSLYTATLRGILAGIHVTQAAPLELARMVRVPRTNAGGTALGAHTNHVPLLVSAGDIPMLGAPGVADPEAATAAYVSAVVAIMPFENRNTEDAIVASASALARGLGAGDRCHIFPVTVGCDRKLDKSLEAGERLELGPVPAAPLQPWMMGGETRGVPRAGAEVPPGGILIAMRRVKFGDAGPIYSDASLRTPLGLGPGVVLWVHASPVGGGGGGGARYIPSHLDGAGPYKIIVAVSYNVALVEGNKLSSDAGHKGIVSHTASSETLPFVEATGVTPDLFLNPVGIMTRKVLGMLLEMLAFAAVAAPWPSLAEELAARHLFEKWPWLVGGKGPDGAPRPDVTPFQEDPRELAAGLTAYAAAKRITASVIMVDPWTGKRTPGIAVGISSIAVLRHLAVDKRHAIAAGPLQAITRTATQGRQADGGAKIGNMELGCLRASGAPGIIAARRLLSSGDYSYPRCNACGAISVPHGATREADLTAVCPECGSGSATAVRVPWVTHLVLDHEGPAMGVRTEIVGGGR
jgi:RNA polymerase Rpb2, domain 6